MSKNTLLEIEQLRFALDNVPAFIYIKDKEFRYVYANKYTLELFGCSEDDLLGKDDSSFFSSDTASRLREIDLQVLQGEKTEREVTTSSIGGSERIYWEVKTPITESRDPSIAIGILGISTDITKRKQLERKLEEAALFDELTSLANRRHFFNNFEQALLKSKRSEHYGAILFLDLDAFKQLNDTNGHSVGDQLLIQVAKRLKSAVREIDMVARLGGDEFVILLEDLSHEKDQAYSEAENIAKKAHTLLSQTYLFDKIEYKGSVSIGISLFLGDERSVEEIIIQADSRMYEEKRAKK